MWTELFCNNIAKFYTLSQSDYMKTEENDQEFYIERAISEIFYFSFVVMQYYCRWGTVS